MEKFAYPSLTVKFVINLLHIMFTSQCVFLVCLMGYFWYFEMVHFWYVRMVHFWHVSYGITDVVPLVPFQYVSFQFSILDF